MMRGSRGTYTPRGARGGGTSYRGHSSTYRGAHSGGGPGGYSNNYNSNHHGSYNNSNSGGNHHQNNRDHSMGSGSRFSGGGGSYGYRGGHGGSSFHNSSSSSGTRFGPPNSSRFQSGGGDYKRPYVPGGSSGGGSTSNRDRSPERKRSRNDTSRRDDYGGSNSFGNSHNNSYNSHRNNDGGGGSSSMYSPNRRYEHNSSRGGNNASSSSSSFRANSSSGMNASDAGGNEGGRSRRNDNDDDDDAPPARSSYHHQSGGPPGERRYVNTAYRGSRGAGRVYLNGPGAYRRGGGMAGGSGGGFMAPRMRTYVPGGGSYVSRSSGMNSNYIWRKTNSGGGSAMPIRPATATTRKVLVSRFSAPHDAERKLKIAKLRRKYRENNGDAASDTEAGETASGKPSADAKTDADDDEAPDDEEAAGGGAGTGDENSAADEKPASAVVVVRKVSVARTAVKKAPPKRKVKIEDASDSEGASGAGRNDDDDDAGAGAASDDEEPYQKARVNPAYQQQKLNCCHCRRTYFSVKTYKFHLYGVQHRNALMQTAYRQKARVMRIRMHQRRAQRELEEQSDTVLGEPQFCMLCRLNYSSDQAKHEKSKDHLHIKRILKPSCRICKLAFGQLNDYEAHRATVEHVLSEIEHKTKENDVDVDWGEFQTVDSVGDVDLDDEEPRRTGEGRSDDEDGGCASGPENNSDSGKTGDEALVGVEMLRDITVKYCDLCRTTLTQRTDPETTIRNHCRWRTHIKLYKNHLDAESHRKMRQNKRQKALNKSGDADEEADWDEDDDSGRTAGGGKRVLSGADASDGGGKRKRSLSGADHSDGGKLIGSASKEDDVDYEYDEYMVEDDDQHDSLVKSEKSAVHDDDEDEEGAAQRYDRFKNSEQAAAAAEEASSAADLTPVKNIGDAVVKSEGNGAELTPNAKDADTPTKPESSTN